MTINLYSPDTYSDGPPFAEFERLRRENPVSWQEIPGQPGYWAILRHADVVHVSRNPLLFACEPGGVVLEDMEPERLARMRDMLLSMDPPRHIAYRKPLAPEFSQRIIGSMDAQVRAITREILAGAAEIGDVEFVHDVVGPLPTQVIGQLFGLPEADWALLHRLAQMNTSGQDPEFNPDGDLQEVGSADSSIQMALYGMDFAKSRRAMEPQGDLMDVILGQEFGGRRLSDSDIGSMLVQMITAGNDTTVTMMAGGLWALLEHPDQLDALRQDRALLPGAIEEILRWFTPLHYFRRTATSDTEIAGQPIATGEKVAMYYTSANRDEKVFSDAG
ncbi:MAG: cytochrome P450, partial [Acidimicrobiales bacterium]